MAFPSGEDHDVLDTSLGGHRRLLTKSCILFSLCYKVILNYYPGYKRRNAGLKSPNTPTHLEVLRDGGAKVNAELAGFSSATRRRRRLSSQGHRDRLCLTSSLVDTIQFTNEPTPN